MLHLISKVLNEVLKEIEGAQPFSSIAGWPKHILGPTGQAKDRGAITSDTQLTMLRV